MAEYINKQATLAEYDRVHVGPPGGARKLIEEAPAADVVPVVHASWEEHPQDTFATMHHCKKIRCTHCWHFLYYNYGDSKLYCSNCGARMDGGKE